VVHQLLPCFSFYKIISLLRDAYFSKFCCHNSSQDSYIMSPKRCSHKSLCISHVIIIDCNSNAIPVTGHGGPQGYESSRLPHFLDNRFIDGGEVVSLMPRLPFTPRWRFLVLISVRGWVDSRATVRLEGLGQLKNQMTSSGIKPAAVD
jgi:hypothetical protein